MLIELAVAFRACTAEDLPALEWMGLFTRQRAIIDAAFAAQQRGGAVMLLAIASDFPVGQVWLDFAERGSAALPRLWAARVFPPLQGAGIGRALMIEAERLAAARGAETIELGVEPDNPGARRFYERLGYVPVREEHELVHYEYEGHAMEMDVQQTILAKRLTAG